MAVGGPEGVMGNEQQRDRLQTFLDELGVADLAPSTTPFDPGYDPVTVEAHLAQSGHLMARLKLSMACWMIADGGATRAKIAAARKHGVPTVTGGGPFEIAAVQGRLPEYLDLCCSLGIDRVEAGEGFTELRRSPEDILKLASDRGLEVQYELGKKHEGPFQPSHVAELVDESRRWLDAGAREIVIEAREN